MLSITLTLFGGLALKAQQEIATETPTVYEKGLMTFILVTINVGVVGLCGYQVLLAFRKGPMDNQTKLQRKVCAKVFDQALAGNEEAIAAAVVGNASDETR